MEWIDHKSLLAGLSAETRRRLCAQSDRAGLIQAGSHLALVGAGGVYIGLGLPYWGVVMVPHGILLVFLFTGLHEVIHRTAFLSDRLNDRFAAIFGFLVFLGPEHFRHFHMAHHRHTHDPLRDPELAGGKAETRGALVAYLSGLPDWLWRLRALAEHALGHAHAGYIPPRARPRIVTEARLFLASYAALAAGSAALGTALLLWVWLVPPLLGNPFLRAYLLAEHTRCPHVANMLENTRTTFASRLVRRLAWNMPYHAEHHAYPAVPFHLLPAFHALTRPHLAETARSHGGFLLRLWRAAR